MKIRKDVVNGDIVYKKGSWWVPVREDLGEKPTLDVSLYKVFHNGTLYDLGSLEWDELGFAPVEMFSPAVWRPVVLGVASAALVIILIILLIA